MLHPDVVGLRQFYSSALGQAVRRDIGHAIAGFCQHITDEHIVVGLGFSLPYLRIFLDQAAHILPIMFPATGAMYWPVDKENHTILCHDTTLPLRDNSVHYVLLCHMAEHSAQLDEVLTEIYRILLPGGRVLLIVPNRLGVWTRSDVSPFGSGHPYQISQIRARAERTHLTFSRAETALFYPPSQSRLVMRLSRTLEKLGRIMLPNFGGVLLVELEKQLYASIPEKGLMVPSISLLYPTQQGTPAPSSRNA